MFTWKAKYLNMFFQSGNRKIVPVKFRLCPNVAIYKIILKIEHDGAILFLINFY